MKSASKFRSAPRGMLRQRGVVLFFALVALVAMSLAAVALIRSVDTSTIIAGNLSFKQSATAAGDTGIEAAIGWLAGIEGANIGTNVLTDPAHPFNTTNLAARPGYYSSVYPALDLFDNTTWDNANNNSVLVGTDAAGNTVRYVIQRMCRTPGVAILNADCLGDAIEDNNGQQVRLPQEVCQNADCMGTGINPQIRITTRTQGPRNSVSYVQAFVY